MLLMIDKPHLDSITFGVVGRNRSRSTGMDGHDAPE